MLSFRATTAVFLSNAVVRARSGSDRMPFRGSTVAVYARRAGITGEAYVGIARRRRKNGQRLA